MFDYYRLKMKYLRPGGTSRFLALRTWIGLGGAVVLVSAMILGNSIRNPEAVIAAFVMALMYFFGQMAETYPRFGIYAILFFAGGGALALALNTIFLFANNDPEIWRGRVWMLIFIGYFALVSRSAWRHRRLIPEG